MARMLGDAFVVINPDTRNFRAQADAQIKKALAGLKPTVPLGVDTEGVITQIRSLQAKIRQLGLADFLDVNIPVGRLITQIQLIKRLLSQAKIADLLEVNLDRASLAKQLALLQNLSQTIPVKFDLGKLPVVGPFQTLTQHVRIAYDAGRLPVLGPVSNLSENIRINVPDLTSARNAFAALGLSMADVQGRLGVLDGSIMHTGATIAAMGQDLRKLDTALKTTAGVYAELAAADVLLSGQNQRLTANFRDLARAQGTTALAAAALTGGKGGGGGGLAGLTAGFAAGGGAIGAWGGRLSATIPILGLTIRSVAAWHIVLDAIIEALIAVGLAVTAAIPGLLVLVNIGQDLQTHFQAVHTVTESLGQAIPPLTGKFDQLAKAMAPQAIEIFGGAMNIIAGRAGLFSDAATRVIGLFDNWIAKIDLWANAQGTMGRFITAGIGYLTQFGQIIGNVVSALGNLLTKDPGIAHYLLDIVNAAALLLKAFSDLPGPVVYAVLALHGVYLWASVITPLLINAALAIVKLGISLAALAANPLTWITVAAAGLAYMAYESTQATSAVKGFISAIDQKIAADNATSAILDIAAAIGQLSQQARSVNLGAYVTQYSQQFNSFGNHLQAAGMALQTIGGNFARFGRDIPQSLATWPNLIRTVKDFGSAIKSLFTPGQDAAAVAVKNNIAALNDEIAKLVPQQAILFRVAGLLVSGNNSLTKSSYTLAEAFALEDLAGVKAGDTFDLARQKVANLVTGYQDMSVQGGILENSVNAITFASLQQQSQIGNLNSAWATFISTVTGGLGAFATFETQVYGIAAAAASSADTLSVSGGKAHLSLSGIGAAAQAAGPSITGLSQASLQLQSAFVQGVTNADQLISALTLEASAAGLGAHGTDMLTAAVKDTVAQLIPMAGNSVAAQAALIALAQRGGAPAGISFQQLSQWVTTASGSMMSAGKAGGPAAQLNTIVGTLAKTSSDLTTDVQNLSIALGTTLNNAMATAIIAATGGTKRMEEFATAILTTGLKSDATQKAALGLAEQFVTLTGSTKNAHDEFVSFAENALHLTQAQAETLWHTTLPGLQGFIDAMHGKNIPITSTLSGSGGVTVYPTPTGAAPTDTLYFRAAAAGGRITGGIPGRDSVLGMLMPGEVVVPTAMVNAGAVDNLRGKLPGFAGGGIVDPSGWLAGTAGTDLRQFALADLQHIVQADLAKMRAAQAAAAVPSGGGALGGDPAANKALAWQMFPADWKAAGMWPSFDYLEMAEAGYNRFARNQSSGAYGIPQALPESKLPFAGQAAGGSHAGAQLSWMFSYIRSRWGSPFGAALNEQANHWYGGGGLVPGFASGGAVASQGAAFLRAWQTRHGGGFGAAWGPIPVNPQIDAMYAMLKTASTLAGASGLTPAQHAYYSRMAAIDRKKAAALTRERDIEREWRAELSTSDIALSSWITAAGATPSLQPAIRKWKAQRAWQNWTIGNISAMLGLSAAQIAAAQAAGTLGPGGAALPAITHTYGAVTDVIEAYLQSHAAPFTGAARGGLVMSYDSGGWMPSGLSLAWNGTGRPEPVGSVPVTVTLEVGSGGSSAFDQFMLSWIRRHVKLKGGGSVQKAFGAR